MRPASALTRAECFAILGVPEDASREEIHAAFRRLVQELHPDKRPIEPDAQARFMGVVAAYRHLRQVERAAAREAVPPHEATAPIVLVPRTDPMPKPRGSARRVVLALVLLLIGLAFGMWTFESQMAQMQRVPSPRGGWSEHSLTTDEQQECAIVAVTIGIAAMGATGLLMLGAERLEHSSRRWRRHP